MVELPPRVREVFDLMIALHNDEQDVVHELLCRGWTPREVADTFQEYTRSEAVKEALCVAVH